MKNSVGRNSPVRQQYYSKHFVGPSTSASTNNLLGKKVTKKNSGHILRENLVEMTTDYSKFDENIKVTMQTL